LIESVRAQEPSGQPWQGRLRSHRWIAGFGGGAWIVVVCAAYTLSQALLVAPRLGLGFDETVYVSQVSPHVPAAFFSAPRARGVSFLVAPIIALTSQTIVLRVYLAVLSGAGLFVALWLWRPLRRSGVLALAGALFASLWVSQFYGAEAMPNLWVALASLAAVGCFLRAARDRGDHRALAGLAISIAVIALMRPADAAWVAVPLFLSAIVVRRWRRPWILGMLCGGLVVGSTQWVIEAYLRYGGLLARLHRSSQIEGGFGLHFAVADQLKSQTGYLLCRPCTIPWQQPIASAWLIALPLIAVASVLTARRTRRLATTLIPVLCAITIAIPYVVLINYAAPRFLLPTYALLAIPAADLIITLVSSVRSPWRAAMASLVVIALAAHIAVQYRVLTHTVRRTVASTGDYSRIVTQLNGWHVRPPCIIAGDLAIPIAFYAKCASAATSGNNTNITKTQLAAAASRESVVIVVRGDAHPPSFASSWDSPPLHGMKTYTHYRVYISPPPPAN
jgi:hypothetical protein